MKMYCQEPQLNNGLAVSAGRFKNQFEAVLARSVRLGRTGRKKGRADDGLQGEQESLLF